MAKRVYWNTESFSKKVNELTNGEYKLFGKYKKGHDVTEFKHLKCGKVFKMTPHNFSEGQRCPYCRYKSKHYGGRKTFEEFKKRVQELTNNEYDVKPPYVNSKVKIEFIHKVCGNHFMMKPNNFLNGQRCPHCSRQHRVMLRTMSTQTFVKRVQAVYGSEYTILGKYINSDHKVLVRHNKCGNVYYTRPADFLRGHGCPKCAYQTRAVKIGDAHRGSLENVKESIKEILGNQYQVLTKDSDYKGNRQHILIKHLICGHTYRARYSDIQRYGTGCPYCSAKAQISSGEHKILSLLKDNFQLKAKQDFYYGYIIPDLKDKKNLHFDFYLSKQKIAIEYDGQQHYEAIDWFGGKESLQRQQKHDLMKDQYCKNKHIKLIRIPYTVISKSEIKDILSKYLACPK